MDLQSILPHLITRVFGITRRVIDSRSSIGSVSGRPEIYRCSSNPLLGFLWAAIYIGHFGGPLDVRRLPYPCVLDTVPNQRSILDYAG